MLHSMNIPFCSPKGRWRFLNLPKQDGWNDPLNTVSVKMASDEQINSFRNVDDTPIGLTYKGWETKLKGKNSVNFRAKISNVSDVLMIWNDRKCQ